MHRVDRRSATRWARYALLILCGWLAAAGPGNTAPLEEGEFDWGPFFSRMADLHGDTRFRALGPLIEQAEAADGDQLAALRPFYVRAEERGTGRTHYEFVWPVAAAKAFKDQWSWRVLTAFYLDFDRTDPDGRYRFWLLPIWFHGRNIEGDRYAALFPVYGQINEFLGQDYINFLLWPLWSRTGINEVESRHVLWPVFSHTSGKGIHRFRFFPFYGYSRHRDRFQKRFILWPLWTQAEYAYPTSYGKGYILFPLYGRIRLSDESTTFVLPPFFRYSRGDRARTLHAPWPLIQYKTGEEQRLYLFPLWGRRTLHGNHHNLFFWPIGRRYAVEQRNAVQHGLSLLPFYYSDRVETLVFAEDTEPEVRSRYVKLWPLVSYRREKDIVRLRALELWPLKQTGPVERGWAPFWTLGVRTWKGEDLDSELLWGLYRHRRREGSGYRSVFPLFDSSHDKERDLREFNLLKGLVGYRREGDAKSVRFLYLLRFGQVPAREKEGGAAVTD